MFPTIRKPTRGVASSFAMALALASGAVLATAATAPDVMAQGKKDKKQTSGPAYSDGFRAVYAPVANMASGEAADYNAVRGQLPAVEAAIENDEDRYAAGNLTLIAGNQLSDGALQRKGLELMLASGKVDPAKVGQFQSFVGGLAVNQKDYAAAETALAASVASGYKPENVASDITLDPQTQLLQVYLLSKQGAKAAQAVQALRQSASASLPEMWLQLGLQGALDSQNNAAANELAAALMGAYPTQKNIGLAQQVAVSMNDFTPAAELDLLRLMRDSGTLSRKVEYQRYIENADARVMSNEVEDVLALGLSKGQFTSSDPYYVDVKSVVDQRKDVDRKDLPSIVADADKGNGKSAMAAADVLYSLDDFARAEKYYLMAAEKGGIDANAALTRAGISQYKQGKIAEAQATFGKVSGGHAAVAKLWSAYVGTKA